MGFLDKIMNIFYSKVNAKIENKTEKHAGLSDTALLEKDFKKRRQVIRKQISTGAAGGACYGTSGISAPIHGGIAAYESRKLAKNKMTSETINHSNEAKRAQGKPILERLKPSTMQILTDTTSVVLDGGLGVGAGKDALKAFMDQFGKWKLSNFNLSDRHL